jgi:hypothetical protein
MILTVPRTELIINCGVIQYFSELRKIVFNVSYKILINATSPVKVVKPAYDVLYKEGRERFAVRGE